jgi:hypothetical protein
MKRALRTIPLSLLCGSLLATWTQAARAADPDPSAVEQATRLLHDAKVDYTAGRFEPSRAKLAEACALAHTPNCVHNLAMAELKTGHPLEAYKHFRESMATPSAGWMQSADAVTDARKMMADAYAAIGHVTIRVPDGASVTLDGAPVEASQDPVDVSPGAHLVEARLGARVGRVQLDARAGGADTVTLRLDEPSAGTAAGPPGSPAAGSPAAGSPGGAEAASSAASAPPDDGTATGGTRRWLTTRRWIGIGVLAVGAAGFVLNPVFYQQAKNAPDPSTHNTYATWTLAALGLGVLGVAGGAALLLWPDAPAKTAIVPAASPGLTGLLLLREF